MKPTHKKQILEYLKKYKRITAKEAIEFFDCYRLSARILELRDQGFNIVTEIKNNNHAEYILLK